MLTRRGFAGFASFAICVTYRVHCDRSVGARRATRGDGRCDAKDFVADGRSDAGLYDAARRSND